MERSDTKFYNASVRMDEALLALLEHNVLEDISITDICGKADVNRSTFYAHYTSVYDLLEEAQQRLIQDFFDNFNETPSALSYLSEENLRVYLFFIKQHAYAFPTFVGNTNAFSVDYVYESLQSALSHLVQRQGTHHAQEAAYIVGFYLNGATSIIEAWVQDGCETSVSRVAALISRCIPPGAGSNRGFS